jgi:hypothetical protein
MLVMVLVAFVVLAAFGKDYAQGGYDSFGWDARAYCAAADAYGSGRDPYYVKNYLNNEYELPYSYLPVTLELFRPICVGGVFVRHFKQIYLCFALISAFLLAGFSFARRGRRDALLKILFVFGGLQGFQWALRTGNLAMIDGVFTALALFLLYRGFSLQQGQDKRSELYYVSGAAVLGLTLSLKLIFVPLLAGFYFLPLARARKWMLICIAVVCFALPILISYVFYHDLFFSWLDCILGRIPNQDSAATEVLQGPSLYSLAQELANKIGFIFHKQRAAILFYALAVALIVGSLLTRIVHFVKREPGAGSFFAQLDRRLLANPLFAMRLATLAMLGLALCAPRLKEYSFFELALYAAILATDLPPGELAVLFVVAIVGPIFAPDLPGLRSALLGYFAQSLAAVFCYVVLLLDLKPAFTRLAPAGQINE